MNSKIRIKLLNKIAQTTDAPPTEIASQVNSSSILPPPLFQASKLYPLVNSAFNTSSVQIIDNIFNILNSSLHYATAGKINLITLRNENFGFDASGLPSPDQKNLANLSKKAYQYLLNSGNTFQNKLNSAQVIDIIKKLSSSQELNNLSSLNPTGPLSQKISGNLKTLINNLLTQLQLSNPVA